MIISFHPCFDSGNQIILGDRPLDSDLIGRIQNAEAIILPQSCTEALFKACLETGALLFPDYRKRFEYPGKIGQSRLFKGLGLPHPETLFWTNVEEFLKTHKNMENPPHQWPFILKEDRSHEAEGVYVAEDPKSLGIALQRIALKEKSGHGGFVTQDLINSGGNVLRAIILGREIISYWKRPAIPGQIITTISRGAIIDHRWRPKLREKGRHLTLDLFNRTGINLAAIDFVVDESKGDQELSFLEINYYFGRRGVGGSERYYKLLFSALQAWLLENGFGKQSVRLL
jgi:ribosomal protein S6--L-glutamate ligase